MVDDEVISFCNYLMFWKTEVPFKYFGMETNLHLLKTELQTQSQISLSNLYAGCTFMDVG